MSIFYHGGVTQDFTIDTLDPFRTAQKQGKNYGGFYMYGEQDVEGAIKYAVQENGIKNTTDKGLLKLTLDDDLKVYEMNGEGITRISEEQLRQLKNEGYDLISGKPIIGKKENVLLNRDKIAKMEFASIDDPNSFTTLYDRATNDTISQELYDRLEKNIHATGDDLVSETMINEDYKRLRRTREAFAKNHGFENFSELSDEASYYFPGKIPSDQSHTVQELREEMKKHPRNKSQVQVEENIPQQPSKRRYTARRGPELKTKEYGQSGGKFKYNENFSKTQSAKSQFNEKDLNKWWSNFKTTEDGSLITNINGENVVLKDWEFTTLEGKGTFLHNKVTGELVNEDLQRVGKNGSLYSLKGELLADASENSAIVDVEYKEVIGDKHTTVSKETAEKLREIKQQHIEATKREVESINVDNIEPNLEMLSEPENVKASTNGADNVVDKVENDIKKEYDFSAKKDEIRERLSKDRRRRYNKQHPNEFFQGTKSKDAKEVLHEKIGDRRNITKAQYKQGQHEVRDSVRKLKKKVGENFVREDVEEFASDAVKKMKPKLNGKVLGIAAAAAAVVGITAYGINKHSKNKKAKKEAHEIKIKNLQKKIDYNMADNNKATSMAWQQPYLQQANNQMIDNSNAMQMAKDISSYRYGKKMTGFI